MQTEREAEQERLQRAIEEASEQERVVQSWAEPRHLAAHYGRLVRALDDLARKRNTAARLAKGTVPRWFAVLPCDRPFEVWETRRDHWGDTLGRTPAGRDGATLLGACVSLRAAPYRAGAAGTRRGAARHAVHRPE